MSPHRDKWKNHQEIMSLEMLPEGLFSIVETSDEEMQLVAIQTVVFFCVLPCLHRVDLSCGYSSLPTTTEYISCYYECLRLIRVLIERSETEAQEVRASPSSQVTSEVSLLKQML